MRPFPVFALTALALLLSPVARAFSKLGSSWPSGSIPLRLQLDATAPSVAFPLTDGSASWNALATSAIADWNNTLSRARFTAITGPGGAASTQEKDGFNQVFFANNYYGLAFDSRTLAVTLVENGDQTIRTVEADLIVNKSRTWNSYTGPIIGTALDLRRVLLHEFGHVLGLDHPDQATPTQNVSAIMNSTISNLDTLTADDLSGATYLYSTPIRRPAITTQPSNQTTTAGASALLMIGVDNQDPPTADDFHSYHWYFKANGATDYEPLFTLIKPGSLPFRLAQLDDAGSYYFQAITPDDTVKSSTVTLTVHPVTVTPATQLSNLSTRGIGGASTRAMIVGFVVTGTRNKSVLLRAAGPGLAAFGVSGTLADPQLVLKNSAGTTVATSATFWDQPTAPTTAADIRSAFGRAGAFAFASGSRDAVILTSLAPGAYTATTASPSNATGTVLIEAYDVDTTPDTTSRLSNLSTRGSVTTGTDTFIAGFTVRGTGPRTYLVRIAGDTLGSLGVTTTLDDPFLSLYTGTTLIREKDDWDSPATTQPALRAAFTSVGAFAFADRQEPAMIVTLPPGSYTARATGLTNDGHSNPTGNALVEIYELP